VNFKRACMKAAGAEGALVKGTGGMPAPLLPLLLLLPLLGEGNVPSSELQVLRSVVLSLGGLLLW
jgi:hypothetical protein